MVDRPISGPGPSTMSRSVPPTVLTWTHGVLPQPLRVDVYRCTGVLELSVAARSGRPDVFISAGGLPPAILPLPPGRRLRLRVPAPPGGGQCSYTIRTDGDLSLTALAFEGGAAPAQAGAVTAVQRLASTAIPGSTPSPGERPKLAYCINGNFQMLPAGAHSGAKQASFVQGTGLTCVVPPGYVHQGYATEDVPPGIYPLYVPPAG